MAINEKTHGKNEPPIVLGSEIVFTADKSGIMFIVKSQPAPLPFVMEYNHAVSRTATKILAFSCAINNLLPINRRDV